MAGNLSVTSAYNPSGVSTGASAAANKRPTGANARQEPSGLLPVDWPKKDRRWKLMLRQWWPFILPTMIIGAMLIVDFTIAGLEMNGKRIFTVASNLYWRTAVAGASTLFTILVLYLSVVGIREKGVNIYDHSHYSPFMTFVTVTWLCTIATFGLQMTFYSYASVTETDLWNNFNVSRYGPVSLDYQRIESRMLVIYQAVFTGCVAAFITAAGVFKAWMYPTPSQALLKGKFTGPSKTETAGEDDGNDDDRGGGSDDE